MLIYSPIITPRIRYTFQIVFERLLQNEVSFTTDLDFFSTTVEPKLAYSTNEIKDVFWIEAVPLLFEKSIEKQIITSYQFENLELFFPTQKGQFPVDIFAVIFFLISRYEEYYPDNPTDKHKRFSCFDSVAYQLRFHRKLIAHRIAKILAKKIQENFSTFSFHLPEYQQISTYDVDIAFQYKGKPFWRNFAAFAKAISTAKWRHAFNYLKAGFGCNVNDDFDTFIMHQEAAKTTQNKPIHFLLTAPYGRFDKNISAHSAPFKHLINNLKQFSEIGLHPSYYSSIKNKLIETEKQELEKIAKINISKSRQHYLRFQFPSTFVALQQAGISDDYSLGWHNEAGFRCAIAVPYPFFNLLENKEVNLLLHPLIYMDGIFNSETEQEILAELKDELELFGGDFITLAHNSHSKKVTFAN